MRVGNYTLGALLGRGGTSEVYAGEHRFLGDVVAVKLLRRALAGDERTRDAFLAEAARTREIAHGNVVRVIDFGHDDASGSLYLVMERIEGDSLATRLRERGSLDEAELRALGAAIADGIAAAHARGIVHRDLKPGNVMLRADGTPAIVDFGIAKSLGDSSAAVTERRIGTVAYMAPEQLTEGLITPAVDIWALGVILYEAATAQPPFLNFENGRLPQLFDTPPRPSTIAPVSASLDALIMRCLEKDPAKRPSSMVEVARVLRGGAAERVTEDIGAVTRVDAVRETPRTTRKRWPLVVIGAITIAVAAIIGVAFREKSQATAPADAAFVEEVIPMTPTPPPAVEPAAPQPTPAPDKPVKRAKPKPTAKPKTTRQGETLD